MKILNYDTTEIRIAPVGLVKGAVYAAALALTYYSAFVRMITYDWALEDYSHCMLVPLVVLYLLWEKRREIAAARSTPSWTGIALFGISICLFWLGELAGEYFTLYISFWLVVVGLICMHLGWQKIKAMWFALIMILAMFPFPGFITTRITFQLRLISSKLGVWMLHLYGMSAYREGNVIDLGFTQLQVVDACSGLRYVMPLMVLGLLLAYWFRARWWKRVVLFLSSIPLAIIVNAFRIAATGVLYSMFGSEVAEGFFHGFSGWLIFIFAIPLLLAEMWALRRIPPKDAGRRTTDDGRDKDEEAVEAGKRASGQATESIELIQPTKQTKPLKQALLQPMFVASVMILLATFGLSHGIEFRQKIPISRPFSQFAMQLGEYQGVREDMEQQYLDILKFSDYIIVNYKNPQGELVNFYVAYYQDQRKGESIHSPETCLPAGGWEMREAGTTMVPLKGTTSPMPVNKAFIEKGGQKQLSYYWFPMRGRVLTNLYQMKLYTFWDSLTRQRTDGALVRLITPVYEKEDLQDAEARLQGFMREIVPALDEFIPK